MKLSGWVAVRVWQAPRDNREVTTSECTSSVGCMILDMIRG